MKGGKKSYNLAPLASLAILTGIFCLFVLGFEKYSVDQAQARLDKHARVVADSLWNFNPAGVVEYLRLAAEADNYARLEIVNKNGDIFQEAGTGPPSGLERLLLAVHLIPRVELVTPVWSKTDLLGWVKAVWIPTTSSIHGAVFVFLLMVHLVVVLYSRILKQKQLLEQRVAERTFELSQANQALKREIHERTLAEKEREELQRNLERSKKMETLGLLAGGVAHDLNNVLSGIVSYPDMLLHDMPEDNPMRRVILTIRDSGVRAAEIVQDLLTLARRGVVIRKTIDLNDLIDEYCSSPEYRKLLDVSSGKIEIELQLEPNLARIVGSPVGLKKVLMNLVANGVEAQPHGGSIRIGTKNVILAAPLEGLQRLAPGEYIVLTVADKGEGIGQDDRQRIFEPFYTKKVMGRSGTGLGLTVVWGTVEDHGGAVDIDSQVGLGTTISVYLPVSRDMHQPDSEDTEVHRDLIGHGETILVVDDVMHQREIACAMLKRLNYTPLAVESGEAAISLVQSEDIDLLLLDMIMDGIDGLETYRGARNIRPAQKAIIVSGFSETDRVHEAQRLGAGACLKKPYTFNELALAVKQELQRSGSNL